MPDGGDAGDSGGVADEAADDQGEAAEAAEVDDEVDSSEAGPTDDDVQTVLESVAIGQLPIDDALISFLQNPTTEGARALLRRSALTTLRPRAAGIQENILRQRRLASGSAREALVTLDPEFNQIQQQLAQQIQTIARQGGLSLGGQRDILQGRAVGDASTQIQELFTRARLAGNAGLLNAATGVTGTLSTQLPPPQTSIRNVPFDLAGTGATTAQLANALNNLGVFNSNTSSVTSPTNLIDASSTGFGGSPGGGTQFSTPPASTPFNSSLIQTPQTQPIPSTSGF